MATKNTKKHGIGWLNVPGYIPQTWNPIVGCSKISEGCRNCYAERMANRLKGMGTRGYTDVTDGSGRWNGILKIVESELQKPLGWKKPRAIFVNSMGDLFHENTSLLEIDEVFRIIGQCAQHLFIVLTKRADRMMQFMQSYYSLPSKNVWLGVTVEDQEAADERIPHLLNTPCAVRFVSCEPLLGPVDLCIPVGCRSCNHPGNVVVRESCTRCGGSGHEHSIDWIIAGGESGANQEVRPGHAEWFRSLHDQALEAGVPFFFKQWGNPAAYAFSGFNRQCEAGLDKTKRTGGDMLDGQQHHNWPQVTK